jgi:hypothetical protein
MAHNALVQPVTPAVPAIQPTINQAASCAASPAVGPVSTWPIYSDPCRQAFSN